MRLSGSTKIHDLLIAHPFLEDFLASLNPKFEMLRNRMARATIGRVATLRTAAGIANLDLSAFLKAIAAEVERRTGQPPETDLAEGGPGLSREQRVDALREIISDLHRGGDMEEARRRFSAAVEDVEASEIATMEEELIRGGLPVSEVQRLCDVHVGAFRQALDGHGPVETPPGHPVHTYMAGNRVLAGLADELGTLGRAAEGGDTGALAKASAVLDRLAGVENHYQRKENQLFPLLERHGVTGPSKVMWGVHDQIRGSLKKVREAARRADAPAFAAAAPGLARDLVEMIYKEEKILFPMALQQLSEEEWAEVRRGEDHLGYPLARPETDWPIRTGGALAPAATPAGLHELTTGILALEQLNLLFSHLPVDLSFVDENDVVRFYSEGPDRIFPRTPAVIGRSVQNCHPPGSVHVVQEILESFRAGRKSLAEFWIQLQGRFIHIRYLAVRDRAGAYRGCLEVSQDVTSIRKLEGEKRLLQWNALVQSEKPADTGHS